jgi:hypothetical protein
MRRGPSYLRNATLGARSDARFGFDDLEASRWLGLADNIERAGKETKRSELSSDDVDHSGIVAHVYLVIC